MAGPVARQGTIPGLVARNNQQQYSPRKGAKIGSADRSGIGTAALSKLVKVTFEDGSSVHVTPEHAKEIRSRGKAYSAAAKGAAATGHRVSGSVAQPNQ